MVCLFFVVIGLVIGGVLFTRKCLFGPSLARYNGARYCVFDDGINSESIARIDELLVEMFIEPAKLPGSKPEKLAAKRKTLDTFGKQREHNVEFTSSILGEVEGEWTIGKNCNQEQVILYIHGGAFTTGSAKSHRSITANLAKTTNCAVFAPNYRRMPENERLDCIWDCLNVFKALLKDGMKQRSNLDKIVLAGDSAGGNIVLVLAQQIRNLKLRQPDALICFSALTDSGFQSPSIKQNVERDLMLKPLGEAIKKIPLFLYVWIYFLKNRISPADTRVSPIHGNLRGLPPTLLQVSAHELLLDDSVRYASKSQEVGEVCELQIWPNMCHVWHVFDDILPEADQAIKLVSEFLEGQGIGK